MASCRSRTPPNGYGDGESGCMKNDFDSGIMHVNGIGSKKKKSKYHIALAEVMLEYSWTQTSKDITISVQLDPKLRLQNDPVEFTDKEIRISFTEQKEWCLSLHKDIKKTTGAGRRQSSKLVLFAEKAVEEEWPVLERGDCQDGLAEVALVNNIEDNSRDDECRTKDEEPIYMLEQIKHGYYDTLSNFNVQVFVKGVDKDSVKIHFKEKHFSLKFQTSDGSFLNLHPNTSKETVFCWKVDVIDQLDDANCSFRVKPSSIEIKLAKAAPKKWDGLEASARKESPVSRSDSWISTRRNQPEVSRDQVAPSVALDEKTGAESEAPVRNKFTVTKAKETNSVSSQDRAEKPTVAVSPLKKEVQGSLVTRGYTGLDNLGNTCYMNSVLQALANTHEFRDYFLDSRFQNDLNHDNPFGSGGCLAVQFATVMRMLWSGNLTSYSPKKLLFTFGGKNSQFSPGYQHDAHEFMAFLLDGLHEDLNRVKKPVTDSSEMEEGPDEEVARQSWQKHLARNNSLVVDQFHGQYKSKLTCLVCGKVSITFDPFMYLAVPIPKPKVTVTVTFMRRDPGIRPVKYQLKLPQNGTVEHLKAALSKKTGVRSNCMRVFEASSGKVKRFFGQGAELVVSYNQFTSTLVVCEVLSEKEAGEKVWEIKVMQRTLSPHQYPTRCNSCKKVHLDSAKLKRCRGCLKVGYCDVTCQRNNWPQHRSQCRHAPEPVGCPFILSLPESQATYSQLCQLLEAFASYSVTITRPQNESQNNSGSRMGKRKKLERNPGSVSPQLTTHASLSNLSSSSSQSSGSLNSLDSQSSGNSTCTLTADIPQDEDLEDVDMQAGVAASHPSNHCGSQEMLNADSGYASLASDQSLSSLAQKSASTTTLLGGEEAAAAALQNEQADSGSQEEEEEEAYVPPFFIKPVNQDGQGLKDVDRIEDKGNEPLDFSSRNFISVDWRNNKDQPIFVEVHSKELEADFEDDLGHDFRCDSRDITLQQCLQLFTEPENLGGSEAWRCPKCKKEQEANKQLALWRLPHTLVIQLKRFYPMTLSRKVEAKIDFPISGLDLSEFCMGRGDQGSPLYDLYAVVNHTGGVFMGHYYSYVRCSDSRLPGGCDSGWRLCNDDKVRNIDESRVCTKEAYLLFYRRRCPPSPTLAWPETVPDNKDLETASATREEAKREEEAEREEEAWFEVEDEKKDSEREREKEREDKEMDEDVNFLETPEVRGGEEGETNTEGSGEAWVQASGRPFHKEAKAEEEKEKCEVEDLDRPDLESDLNNSSPGLPKAPEGGRKPQEKTYTDMDSLD